jgi:hypothetical protein
MAERVTAFVCNRDRLTWPRALAADLGRDPRCEVVIVDNASTYPPLLAWYESCPYEVIRLEENLGPEAVWRGELYTRASSDYYLNTDGDLDISLVPSDWLSVLLDGFRFPEIDKIGLSLRTDDIPESRIDRDDIVRWEAGFRRWPINERYYWARIDTTLAVYDRRRVDPRQRRFRDRALRTAAPYSARHLPWYPLGPALQEEDDYYILHCDPSKTHWSRVAQEALKRNQGFQ